MADALLVLAAIALDTLVLIGLVLMVVRITRPRDPPPVFTVDASTKIATIGFGAMCFLSCFLVALVSGSPWLIVLAGGLFVVGVLLLRWSTEGDRRLYDHLRRSGVRESCRLIRKSAPTYGSELAQPRFLFRVSGPAFGERELEVTPGAYHSFHEGDEIELLVDPVRPASWQILRETERATSA